jgi:peptidoglycan/xylan/chitin deacetylase (PgdA/CDA1 family)
MTAMGSFKQVFLKTLLLPGFPASLRYVQRDCATVFMLHRFQEPERGITGCDPGQLRRALTYLVKNGYELISLADLFERLAGNGPQPRGAVAFTIDDGYVDQATIAAPIFADFECPVTTFVSTGFLDGNLWFWWDRIEYVFARTARRSIQVRLGNAALAYQWEDDQQRIRVMDEFAALCKRVPETEKLAGIKRLADAAEVEVPSTPPAHCAPMSWEQLRDCEKLGMTFGPHTVTHPVLSRTDDAIASFEITESWTRLRAEAHRPVPIFCYPNGGWDDFGEREISVLRRLGLAGAVVGEPGYANAQTFQEEDASRFRVQRFGFPDELPHMIQYVSGVERFKQILRRTA